MCKAMIILFSLLALCTPVLAQNNYNYPYQRSNPYAAGGVYSQSGALNLNPYGAGGVPSQTGQLYGNPYANPYARYPYANQPGYGYYPANAYAPVLPAYGAPVPINGGMFRFNVGGFSGSYWRSPSGYYYPWGAGAYINPAPIIVVEQGQSQPTQPPVSDMLRDMSSYIEEQNSKKKFKPEDYQHLSRRVRDLQSLDSTYRARNGGTLDSNDEEQIRKDCAMLSGDISRRILP